MRLLFLIVLLVGVLSAISGVNAYSFVNQGPGFIPEQDEPSANILPAEVCVRARSWFELMPVLQSKTARIETEGTMNGGNIMLANSYICYCRSNISMTGDRIVRVGTEGRFTRLANPRRNKSGVIYSLK